MKFEGSFLIVKPTNYSIYWSCQSCAFEGFNGIKMGEYSKSSCQTITKIESMGRCPGTFWILMDRMVMDSHDKSTQICKCCSNFTTNEITASNFKCVPKYVISWWILKDYTLHIWFTNIDNSTCKSLELNLLCWTFYLHMSWAYVLLNAFKI